MREADIGVLLCDHIVGMHVPYQSVLPPWPAGSHGAMPPVRRGRRHRDGAPWRAAGPPVRTAGASPLQAWPAEAAVEAADDGRPCIAVAMRTMAR
jgi:hypothetical protein